jgi:hypothetical protein
MKHTIKFLTVILFIGLLIDNGISQGSRQEKKSIKSNQTKSSTRSDNKKSSGKSVRGERKSVQKSGSEEKTLFEKYGFSSKEELYSFLEGKEIKKNAAVILKKYKSDDDLTDREKRILSKALDTHVKSSSSKSVKSIRTGISKEKADGRDASLRNSKKSKDSRKQGKGAIAKTKKRAKKSKSKGSRNLVASSRLSTTTAVDLGASGCTSANPCDVGESDCDSDSDCTGNLKCYQRSEAGDAPPGVSIPSGFIASHDICYDPDIVTAYNSDSWDVDLKIGESCQEYFDRIIIGNVLFSTYFEMAHSPRYQLLGVDRAYADWIDMAKATFAYLILETSDCGQKSKGISIHEERYCFSDLTDAESVLMDGAKPLCGLSGLRDAAVTTAAGGEEAGLPSELQAYLNTFTYGLQADGLVSQTVVGLVCDLDKTDMNRSEFVSELIACVVEMYCPLCPDEMIKSAKDLVLAIWTQATNAPANLDAFNIHWVGPDYEDYNIKNVPASALLADEIALVYNYADALGIEIPPGLIEDGVDAAGEGARTAASISSKIQSPVNIAIEIYNVLNEERGTKTKGVCDSDIECAEGYTCINNYVDGQKYCRNEKYEVCGGAGCYNSSKGWPDESGFKEKLPDSYQCRYDDQCENNYCRGNSGGITNGRCFSKLTNGESCGDGDDDDCQSGECGQYKDDQYKCCGSMSTWWGEDWCTDLPNGTSVYDEDQCESGYKSESKCAAKKKKGRCDDDDECASGYTCINNYSGGKKYCRKEKYEVCGGAGCYNKSKGWPGESGFKSKLPDNYRCRYDDQCKSGNCSGNAYGLQNGRCD